MNEFLIQPGQARDRLQQLENIGLDFVNRIRVGSLVICWGDPSTKGITQPGRIYNKPWDHNVIVKYTLFEGQVPEKDLVGVLSPEDLTLSKD